MQTRQPSTLNNSDAIIARWIDVAPFDAFVCLIVRNSRNPLASIVS